MNPTPPTPPPTRSTPSSAARSRSSAAVVLVVAVLIGLGIGRFVTAGSAEVQATDVPVAAAADLDERIDQLERAVATDPDDLEALQGLGAAYVDRAAETGDAAFYGLARTAVQRAEQLEPSNPDTMLVRGLLELALHEFDDALVTGQRALELRPDSASVLGVVVDAQVELGRYDAATETLQAMLDRKPGLPALSRTSYLRELSGDLDGAVTAMQQAQAAGSSSPYATAAVSALLGDLLLHRGQVDAASAAYDAALRSAPALTTARVGAARVAAVRGDLAGALTGLEQLTQEQPTVDGLVLLADLQKASGDTAAAEATAGVVRAVADLQGQQGQVVDLEMALFEADAGQPARSLELARAAHDARPDNVFTTDALAWATFRSGDVPGAAALSAQALRMGSVSPVLRWHAAEIAAAAGAPDDARAHLDVVLQGAPYAAGVDAPSVRALAERLGAPLPALWRAGGSA